MFLLQLWPDFKLSKLEYCMYKSIRNLIFRQIQAFLSVLILMPVVKLSYGTFKVWVRGNNHSTTQCDTQPVV